MIPIAMPVLDAAEAEAAYKAIKSGWVSQGPQVAEFEHEFATFVGARHACAVSNCTTALHLALVAIGVGPGDEIVTASHSFIATANAIRYCGATPVFADIIPDTYNLDPAEAAAAITSRTKAILVVHQMGMPCDLSALRELAAKHRIALIEDAACAVGSEVQLDGRWERIGKPHGLIACFSFHPRKVITTGEGGMLTTNDPDLDQKFRLLRQHGMSVPDTVRHGSAEVIFENYLVEGFNYRMTDIQAAIGRRQLERLPSLFAKRRLLASRYAQLLREIDELALPFEPSWARSNWQSYCVRLPARLRQKAVMQSLLDQGISTRRGIMCSHREAPYLGAKRASLRQSELAQDHCILLPIYAQMTDDEQEHVARALKRELSLARLDHIPRTASAEAPHS
jgi:dTDP-4-amino-4,6-dideoxygalactose transaminase